MSRWKCIRNREQIRFFKDKDEIEEYVLSEEGIGKAGAYGIHGPAGKYVSNIIGSYTNVVGLPVHETYEILRKLKIS